MKVNLKTLDTLEARELRIRKEVSQLRSIKRQKHQARRMLIAQNETESKKVIAELQDTIIAVENVLAKGSFAAALGGFPDVNTSQAHYRGQERA